MPVVSNSSPLILFAKIGWLDLLKALYGEVLIPAAVHHEVVGPEPPRAGAVEVAAADWIRQESIRHIPAALAARDLGTGETEAIVLAKERGLTLVVDDPGGRAAARDEGVQITGTAGVLLAAKRRKLLTAIRPTLDALVSNGLRLDRALYIQLLELAAEA